MAGAEIRIIGLEQIQRRLTAAPSLLVAKAFYYALDRAIGVIAAEVEARTPEGEEGLLKESIITNVKVDLERKGGTAVVGFRSTPSERTEQPQDLIALWVEYGHQQVTHGTKKGGGKKVVRHVPAHPFMRPAAQAAFEQAALVFGETLIDHLSVIEEA